MVNNMQHSYAFDIHKEWLEINDHLSLGANDVYKG